MHEIDAMLTELTPKLAALAPGITAPQVRAVLEPAALDARMLRPFAHACKIASPLSLPGWTVAVARDAVDDFLENGAALFDAEFAPPPQNQTPTAGPVAAAS